MSKVETAARDWYAEGLRVGADSKEQRILYILTKEAERTSTGTFNANGVLVDLIALIKGENK